MFECQQIQIEAICCDYGPLNKSLLKSLGVYAEFCKGETNILNIPDYIIVNTFQNPFRHNYTIKVFLDFTHLFKRLKGQFERTDIILNDSIPAEYIKQFHLSPVDKRCSFHWIRLLNQRENEECIENGAAMCLTNLTHADIWPTGFQRMRVKHSSKVISENGQVL